MIIGILFVAVSTTPAIGIDLGTTYSCVAVWQNNRAEIIPDDQGNRTTPSYVAFTDTQRIIGSEAKDPPIPSTVITCSSFHLSPLLSSILAGELPSNHCAPLFDPDIKRLIGQRYSDPTLQNDARFWPFKVAEGVRDKPLIWQQYKGEEKQFAAEEIAAMLLVKMREIAEAHLGRPVKDAVIAVPASFTDHQREATRNACAIAGLNVMRLINEPTAAAVAYGLDNISRAERNVLVFNLGGGTFDASVLTIDKGFIQVKATAGDAHLGGEDFDNRMIAHFVGYLKQRHGKDISGNPKMMRKLKTECEKAKRFLSSANRAIIEIDNLFEGTDFSSTITRDLFEELNADLFAKCVKTVDKCLNDAKVDKRRIDQVVLVGGSTRIPRVQQLLQGLFDGKELCKSVNPDEAVACGAAAQSAMLRQDGSERLQGLLLVDVASFSLGLEDGGGNMNVLIHKNSTIPAKKELVIPATFSSRPCAAIKVYEGESKKTSDNNLLGRFEISGFPAAERSVLQATVRFDVDADGILNLSITEKNIGKRMNVTRDSSRLGNDEIGEMKQRGNKYKEEDEEHRRKIEAKNELEKYVINVQYAVEEMSRAIERTTGWLEASQAAKVGEFENKMKELKAVCCNLLAKKLH